MYESHNSELRFSNQYLYAKQNLEISHTVSVGKFYDISVYSYDMHLCNIVIILATSER